MPQDDGRHLSTDDAVALAAREVARLGIDGGGSIGEGDFGEPSYWLSLTLTQLDADAMNDRLQAFIQREVEPLIPSATALMDFHHAHAATGGPGDLDMQEVWHDIRPTFRIDPGIAPVTAEDVRTFVGLIPRFHAVVESNGRPSGFRDVHAGAAE